MNTKNIVPLGSVTKTWTAVGIMRLIEEGRMGFNDTIDKHVDQLLKESNGTTLLELWNGDATINTVTIYQLLHMKGGLRDYNDHYIK